MLRLKNVVLSTTTKRQGPRGPRIGCSASASADLQPARPQSSSFPVARRSIYSCPLVRRLDRLQRGRQSESCGDRPAHHTVDRVGEWITVEMTNQVQVAEALALSPSLDDFDFTSFYREAQTLKAARPLWFTVELDDLQGMQVLNLLRPLGEDRADGGSRKLRRGAARSKTRHWQHRSTWSGFGPTPRGASHPCHPQSSAPICPHGRNGARRCERYSPESRTSLRVDRASADRHGNLVAAEAFQNTRISGVQQNRRCMMQSGNPPRYYKGRTLEGIPVDTIFLSLPDVGRWSR